MSGLLRSDLYAIVLKGRLGLLLASQVGGVLLNVSSRVHQAPDYSWCPALGIVDSRLSFLQFLLS